MTPTRIPHALQRFLASWRRYMQFNQTRFALQRLDARTLRDIGLDASEVASVAAEAAGYAEVQRRNRSLPHY